MNYFIILLLFLNTLALAQDDIDHELNAIYDDVGAIEKVIQEQDEAIKELKNSILIISAGRKQSEESLFQLESNNEALRSKYLSLQLRYKKRETKYRKILVREQSKIIFPTFLATAAYFLAPKEKLSIGSLAFIGGAISEYGFNWGLSGTFSDLYVTFKKTF